MAEQLGIYFLFPPNTVLSFTLFAETCRKICAEQSENIRKTHFFIVAWLLFGLTPGYFPLLYSSKYCILSIPFLPVALDGSQARQITSDFCQLILIKADQNGHLVLRFIISSPPV